MPLEGRVAEVLDQYNVVVNIGSNDGVRETDRFLIYELSDPITDPDTGEDLGNIKYTKAQVRPASIMKNKTVMETDETTTTNPLANMKALTGRSVPRKLTTDSDVKENRSRVERGDYVRRTEESDTVERKEETDPEREKTNGGVEPT